VYSTPSYRRLATIPELSATSFESIFPTWRTGAASTMTARTKTADRKNAMFRNRCNKLENAFMSLPLSS
jgi:hypothetical protein